MVMGYLMVHFPTVYFCVFFLIFYNKILKRKKRVEIAELVNLKTSFHAVMYRKTNFYLQMIKTKKKKKEKKTWAKEVIMHIQTSKIQARIYSEDS